jgi:hypothetical protein
MLPLVATAMVAASATKNHVGQWSYKVGNFVIN